MAAPNSDNSPAPAPVHDITQTRRDDRLRDEFALVRVKAPVYIEDKAEAKKRKGSAERMQRMRDRQAEKGLKQAMVPVEVADGIKKAGGWEEWMKTKTAVQEAPKPAAPELGPVPEEVIQQIQQLGGWGEWLKSRMAPQETPKPAEPEPSAIPLEILQQIQQAGGWDNWLQSIRVAALTPTTPAPKPEGTPDKTPPRRQLNRQEKEAIEIGFRVLKCTGPKRWLLKMLLGS